MPSTLTDAAPILVSLALRSAAILAAAWVLTLLMRRASAAARHLTWLAAIVAVLALPVLSVLPGWRVLPRWEPVASTPLRDDSARPSTAPTSVPAESRASTPAPQAGAGSPTVASSTSPSLASTLVLIWIAGAAVVLLPPIAGRFLLWRTQRRCDPIDDGPAARILVQAAAELGTRRPVTLLRGEPNAMPMAWGVLRPRILLPHEAVAWPAAHIRTVLLHELAHIRRHDCLTHLLAQLARALYWPNPLAWLAARALHAERERACDDLVLSLGDRAAPTDYAAQLLTIASGRRLPPASAAAMAMARPSQLEHRIRSILDTTRSRRTMNRTHLVVAAALAAGLLVPIAGLRSASAKSRADQPGSAESYACSSRTLQGLGRAILAYTFKHDQVLPPDLGATMDDMTEFPGPGSPPNKARGYLCASDHRLVPETLTPDWINANSSFLYIASGVKWADLPDPSQIVLAYEDTDHGHEVAQPDGRQVKLFSTLIADCHVDPLNAAMLKDRVAESKATFEALRAGTALPDTQQAAFDLTLISHAIAAYTKSHAGRLPPDLGATLSYLETTPRTSTPAQKAGAYLLPAAKRGTPVPDEPTPEWVNEHTSFVYLGRPGLDLARIPDADNVILVHGRTDQPVGFAAQRPTMIPTASANDRYRLHDETFATRLVANSKRIIDAVATGGPLPDYEHAWRDLSILIDAIERYAADHRGELPPDLGATILYLNPALLAADSPIERARVYLSPAAERATALPDALTPDWVNQHASYVYLGGRGLTLADVQHSSEYALLHTDPNEPINWTFNNDEPAVLLACAFADKSMVLSYGDRDFAARQIATAKRMLDELRNKTR